MGGGQEISAVVEGCLLVFLGILLGILGICGILWFPGDYFGILWDSSGFLGDSFGILKDSSR